MMRRYDNGDVRILIDLIYTHTYGEADLLSGLKRAISVCGWKTLIFAYSSCIISSGLSVHLLQQTWLRPSLGTMHSHDTSRRVPVKEETDDCGLRQKLCHSSVVRPVEASTGVKFAKLSPIEQACWGSYSSKQLKAKRLGQDQTHSHINIASNI